ncbi:hypothetical protein BGZ76_011565 [Entomortierella beljakovae]|nr:hypothetical protein BGZ76_011565 [Entomortierella beljakovae]
MTSRLEQPRIIDKRRTISGTEYLVSTTEEWVPSSTSRCINPELVELYEWLHNSGFREGTTVFASSNRTNLGWAKGARKRLQSNTSSVLSDPQSPKEGNNTNGVSISGVAERICTEEATAEKESGDILDADELAEKIKNEPLDSDDEARNSSSYPRAKKPRLEGLRSEDIARLSITPPESGSPAKIYSPSLTDDPTVKKESGSEEISGDDQEVRDFNRNTEQMIEVYFKEGMDANGVEIFDILLGPYRRPTKEFVASFFYAVILSPFTDPVTVEASIHLLDRILTIHGPEPFKDIWDVQKRRREVADGTSAFSRQSSFSRPTEEGVTSNGEALGKFGQSNALNSTGRLPNWTNIWDLIKTELGLDRKPESRQHIALQERHIRIRLQGDGPYQSAKDVADIEEYRSSDDDSDEDSDEEKVVKKSKGTEQTVVIREEQETREELGRSIIGILLRLIQLPLTIKTKPEILVSMRSFFCRDVLTIDPFSPGQSVRQTLDVVFQIIGLGTSSRYLKNYSTDTPQESTTGWPLNTRYTLNSSGMEILQLGLQFLLLLVRYTEAGQLLPGKGLEELAREVLSRLTKLNRDKKASKKRAADRYNLDRTELFLKTLIQGSCLLESGTGSGAGVKLRKEEESKLKESSDGDYSIYGGDQNGIFKSQTGICMGSSVFVMILVDLWFRTKTTSVVVGGAGSQLSFSRVVEEYAMPSIVRSANSSTTAKATKPKSKPKPTPKRAVSRRTRSVLPTDEEAEVDPQQGLTSATSSDHENLEQWNSEDLEQLEWTVMMIETLVWSWVEARGIRREEIGGTGLEKALYPDDTRWRSKQDDEASGWLVMSQLLSNIGGTLKTRWEQLENVIEAAITVEDLCLR